MINKLFVSVVFLLWTIAMWWLVSTKILAPLDQDEPPSYRHIPNDERTCWRVFWDKRPIGWTASRVETGPDGTKEIHARLQINQLELNDVGTRWKKELEDLNIGLDLLDLDARSRIEIDPLGHLSALEARVRLDPLPFAIEVYGRVEKSELQLHIQTGKFSYEIERMVPDSARLTSALAPAGKLPAMYIGRRWQMETINPLTAGKATELIEAEVTGEEIIQLENSLYRARRLEYRRLNQAGVNDDEVAQATLWIGEDGTVLLQEVNVLGAKLRLERRLGAEADHMADALTQRMGQRNRMLRSPRWPGWRGSQHHQDPRQQNR
ncbi:MAG: hypothetical protein JW829_11850 [Pirellulales bacterium]|nr:hypothetical protein [Pirellulales bacterium]